MKCPNCKDVALRPVMTKQGVVVDYCDSCKGVWLDRGELFHFAKKPMRVSQTLQDALKKQTPTHKRSIARQRRCTEKSSRRARASIAARIAIGAIGIFDAGAAQSIAIASYAEGAAGAPVNKEQLKGAIRWDLRSRPSGRAPASCAAPSSDAACRVISFPRTLC